MKWISCDKICCNSYRSGSQVASGSRSESNHTRRGSIIRDIWREKNHKESRPRTEKDNQNRNNSSKLLAEIPCCPRLPEKERAKLGMPVLPVKIFIRLCVTGKRNGTLELCLSGLLAGTEATISNLTRAFLARYNSFQGTYLSGKPAIDRRLARRIRILTTDISSKNRSC